uniref:Uncharacterized protein n=1 Tax=Neogobius melanostomus TaxID=47308 RepID=A0A8C6UIZ7_9GOBI
MACISEDLTCSICLSVFTEPVMLLCGHSFCRECISVSLDKQKKCPVCRASVDTEGQSLLTNHVLKSLVEKTKQKLQYRHDKEGPQTLLLLPAFLCPDHDEKLKLYCITDQQLACVICRDSQKHESHKFKPVSEAAALVRAELQILLNKLSADTDALERLVQSQREEVDSTKRQSGELKSLISSKFEEMYKFLQKREQELTDKVKRDDENGFRKMTEKLCDIEAAIAENRKLEATVTSALQIQDHERFLKTWSEEEEVKAVKCSFRPKGGDFQVQKTELSLGPYESHLQLFVWKEMLQVVTPREERLLLETDQTSLMVSQDQRSYGYCNGVPNSFAGQHYWEVYVGQHSHWEIGLSQNYLTHNAGTFQFHTSGHSSTLEVQGKPQKIGIYLNCPRKELSFYNADNMAHIHTASLANVSFPVSAFFTLGYSNSNHDPLVICRY